MAETQVASVGYMGEVWLHNGTALYELVEVTGFDIPSKGEREQVEKTHLKSPDWRREYLSTFYEDADFNVMLNYRPLSDTAVLLDAAHGAGNTRAMKMVIPQNGVPFAQIELTARCLNVTRGEVGANDVMESTATFRIVTIDAVEAYVA
jgi:Lambda phage tail tube protein, TTP